MEDKKRKLVRRSPEPKKLKTTYWFIEPIGAHTNQIIARRLSELGEIPDSPNQVIRDNFGKEHSVYSLVSHKRVLEFYKSQDEFQLKFDVYTRETLDGPITQSLIDTKEFKKSQMEKKNLRTLLYSEKSGKKN